MVHNAWHPGSWMQFPISQQPAYADLALLTQVEQQLAILPPLVSPQQIRRLRDELANASRGRAFVLQGGDCAESFAEFNQDNLLQFFRVMLQMSITLVHAIGVPVIKVGRIAGQFAKPRSSATESKDGVELPAYRGDMVNAMDFDPIAREPDPRRFLDVYYQAAATLNYLRSLAAEGYASLHNIRRWNSEFIANCPEQERYQAISEQIHQAISFMEACGFPPNESQTFQQTTLYTSHEALLLRYETPLVRRDDDTGEYYDCSAHMVWIGERTRDLKGAHIEFVRGIANPVGVKVGPTMTSDGLMALIDRIDPQAIPGRLTLITRMGASNVDKLLPPLVERVQREGRPVVWSCDPMHGNTFLSSAGYKTRRFSDILAEVRSFFDVHHALGTFPGGVHFEMTGQDVTECVGGSQAISDGDLAARYSTRCDPRLNASQSLELAFLIAEAFRGSAAQRR